MHRMWGLVRVLVGAPLGLLFFAITSIIPIYFLYHAARLDKWLWFLGGIFFPPISIVGGVLLWFGQIWQPQPNASLDLEKRKFVESRTVLMAMVYTVDKCRFRDVSPAERGALQLGADNAKYFAVSRGGASDREMDILDGAMAGAAGKFDCGDPVYLKGIRDTLAALRAQTGANFENLRPAWQK